MTESDLQNDLCDYLRLQYPSVIFISDSSGLRVPIQIGKRLKRLRSGRGIPDLFIIEPNKIFKALFLELKKETPYKLDGELKKQKAYRMIGDIKLEFDHILEQSNIIDELVLKGYFASFCWSFEMGRDIIDKYMKQR